MTWIKEIVEGLIEVYKTRNVYEIIEILDIKLIRKEMRPGIKGRFLRDLFYNEYIYISNELSDEEEKVVIAHELGHAILHTNLNSSYYTENHLLNKDKIEYQANKFAAELLISNNIDFSTYDSMTIKEMSCILGVSERLIELKFK
ncbi:ImmA/IrrE family metallo-endopeptidase [Tissierella pigra]|uniref:ImmA/IrrE family metallo-endopeptidase n=1 Tax=Tissierella pigra TaxID=2607614 RepID=A0A6N7XZ83_9FIRM|nr:ImmA/IrrE family metallo-endopeptidase [Tissierella pigra]MSU01795.1 ImmA/IrrE family metallo-endopeptidase [Tissierella pigra]